MNPWPLYPGPTVIQILLLVQFFFMLKSCSVRGWSEAQPRRYVFHSAQPAHDLKKVVGKSAKNKLLL